MIKMWEFRAGSCVFPIEDLLGTRFNVSGFFWPLFEWRFMFKKLTFVDFILSFAFTYDILYFVALYCGLVAVHIIPGLSL